MNLRISSFSINWITGFVAYKKPTHFNIKINAYEHGYTHLEIYRSSSKLSTLSVNNMPLSVTGVPVKNLYVLRKFMHNMLVCNRGIHTVY